MGRPPGPWAASPVAPTPLRAPRAFALPYLLGTGRLYDEKEAALPPTGKFRSYFPSLPSRQRLKPYSQGRWVGLSLARISVPPIRLEDNYPLRRAKSVINAANVWQASTGMAL